MTTLFISPHFDDVVLSCVAHVVEARRHGNRRVLVATLFGAGQTQRQDEDVRALAFLGAEQVTLPFVDAPERLGIVPGFGSLLLARYAREAADREALVEVLRPVVERESVSHVVLPLGVGDHVDHRIAHSLHDALPDTVAISFYEDQPYAQIHGALGARMLQIGVELEPDFAVGCDVIREACEANINASALAVFAGLIEASDDKAKVLSELATLSGLWSERGRSLRSSGPPMGRLVAHRLPTLPALAERAVRCYASQLGAWFPESDADADVDAVRRFVESSPYERTWRKPAA